MTRCSERLIFACLLAASLRGETRRAVIVGIDHYHAVKAVPPVTVQRIPVKGTSTRTQWTDLDGAVNDAREMKAILIDRLGFKENDIVFLTNEQASGDAILSALQSHLVGDATEGDISLFYYAGHGSQIANRRTTEADGLDETIVPADSALGTPDIRDKELARIYREAVRKHVLLTVIQDSCHSGSGARGLWNARGKVRELPRDGRYVEDPPDKGARAPEDDGVLVLSASQDEEPASEVTTDTGAHGLFSFALFHTLETSPPLERVDKLFQRVRALMQSEGVLQEPVMAGAGRDAKSLLGRKADSTNVVTAAVTSKDGTKVRLQGGVASGLYESSELKHDAIRLRIDPVPGLNSSVATVIEGSADSIIEGDLFRLDKWAAPDYADLRVFIPPALPMPAILAAVKTARDAAPLAGAALIEDPTLASPDAVMSWQGTTWILEQNSRSTLKTDLGANPSAAKLTQALRSLHVKNFFLLVPPPSTDLVLPLGPHTSYEAIIPETERARAHYVLFGRPAEDKVAYAWVLPNLTETAVSKSEPPLAMPLRSEWIPMNGEASLRLTNSAAALARVRAWLRLPSPPADPRFPYRLALRNVASGNSIRSGEMVDGQRFKLWLEAPEAALAGAQRRWVYVFEIDREGKGTLFFPAKSEGNVSNRLPLLDKGSAPASLPLTSETWDLEVSEPFGADTFLLLVSEEALPNPEVLDFSAVYKGARGEVESSALGRLLRSVGSGTRGDPPAAPLNWFLDRETFRSVPK